jgi:hypothetical protein
MSLKDQIKAVQTDMPITVLHEQWMTSGRAREYSQKALDFAGEQLAGTKGSQRLRKRMFRASGLHTCKRKQVLTYIGHPKQPEERTSSQQAIFITGDFLHLKWQMIGLSAGWLKEAEVPMDVPELNAGGTADGITHTGGGFEFKSINDRGFGKVMTYGPLLEHQSQTDNYLFLGDLDHYSIVYENKNNGEWREFVRYREEKNMLRVAEEFEILNDFVEAKKLPMILSDCKAGEGTQFKQCPFKDTCLKMKGWPQ